MSAKKTKTERPSFNTHEEAQARLEEMRSWTSGFINSRLSWITQIILASSGWIYLKLFNKVVVLDRNKIKALNPPYLFITNHLTMIDDLFLGAVLFLPFVSWNMKYFPWHVPEEKNFFRGPILTWAMKKARCVPLTRGKGVFQPGMMRLKELLTSENIVLIYPEGTRSRTGDIGTGKVGVARLAYQTKVNIIPCYHEGANNLLPVGKKFLAIGKSVAMIVGDPIDMSDLYAEKEGRETYKAIADRMMDAIRELRTDLHERGHGVIPIPENPATPDK